MLLFILTASLVWHVVLAFFVARDLRLLLKITRWATAIYLVVFGLFVAEVLREGLVVNGADTCMFAYLLSLSLSLSLSLFLSLYLSTHLSQHPKIPRS